MAVEVVPPPRAGNRVAGSYRNLVAFYHDVVAEMKRVTWPEVVDVRRATVAIIIFVLLLGLLIWLLDVVLQQILVRWIPSIFAGGGR